jgi:inactivated superfamily I helicase
MRGHAGQRQQVKRLDTFSRRAMLIEHDVSRYIAMCRDGDVVVKGSPGPRASRLVAPAARAAIPVVSLEV